MKRRQQPTPPLDGLDHLGNALAWLAAFFVVTLVVVGALRGCSP